MRLGPSQWFLPQILLKAEPWEMTSKLQSTPRSKTEHPKSSRKSSNPDCHDTPRYFFCSCVPLLMREGDVNARAGFKLLIPPEIHQ